MSYQDVMGQALLRAGQAAVDPRHVEAHVRAEVGGTLDHLSRRDLGRWAIRVLPFVASMTHDENERLARSYGL